MGIHWPRVGVLLFSVAFWGVVAWATVRAFA